ncbi:MAG: HAMP domain-containing histidine kinase, partial [Ferruginibacter sp.]|nr:HAMP domain-containing histidine kinase [Ferruginibacter sp.]
LGVQPRDRFSISMKNLQSGLAVANASTDAEALATSITISIGNMLEKAGNKSAALIQYEKGLKRMEASGNPEDLANIYLTLGNFYEKNNEILSCIIFLQKSIETGKRLGLLDVQQRAYQTLSNAYEKNRVYDSAIIFYKKFIVIRDSIFNAEKEKEITRKQLTLDFTVKENDYKLVQQITDAKLKEQVLLASQQQQVLQLKQQQLQLVNKEKDLQRLTYLKKQVELQNEKQLQSSILQKNSMQAKYDNEINGKQIAKQKLQINYDEKVKLFLAIAIALALIVTGFIFYSQRKTARLNKIISEQKLSLEQLGNVKDKIFSVVSHDMRAPVNSLMSFIDILEEGKIPQEKLTLYAKELKQNLTYTSALMNNLLNWAASQMQGFKPVKESFDLSLLVTEISNTLQHHIQQKKVIISNQIALHTTVHADRNMMAAILRNLVSNAVKFSYKDGCINIAVATTTFGYNISISDEGIGMQTDQLLHFNKYTQQPTESKRGTANEKGTGLGLLLCKTFATQMGGKISAIKNEKGMTFLLTMPA